MFDIQAIPGETGEAPDWAKMERDLTEDHSKKVSPSIDDVSDAVFEVAVGELGAWRQLLLVLEQRYVEMNTGESQAPASNISVSAEVSKVQADLIMARSEFLKAFQRLESRYGSQVSLASHCSGSDYQPQALNAIFALSEMEIFCRNRTTTHSGNFL